MKLFCSLLISLLIPFPGRCQSGSEAGTAVRLCPAGLLFAPLKAGSQEARMGIFKFLENSEMAVDVGNASEILELTLPDSEMTFALGIDFFGKAFVTGAQGLRLQVDAMDGFFGGHLSWSGETGLGQLSGRLRILHQSAHFVDGHYDARQGGWIDSRAPIPFTRDFGELTLGQSLLHSSGSARYYGGFSYATLVRPTEVERLACFGGIEITFDKLVGSVLDKPSHLYCAYHISLNGTPVYAASHQVQAGIKFGEWSGRGVDFYVAFYDGRQLFGEYYNERVSTLGAGFMVDFF